MELHFDVTDGQQRLCALSEFTEAGWNPHDTEDFLALEQMERHDPKLIDEQRQRRLADLRTKYASTFNVTSKEA